MLDPGPLLHEKLPHVNPSPSSSNVESTSLSSSSPVENYDVRKWEDKKKMKRKDNSVESVDFPTRTPRNPKFPCRLCKGDHIFKYCHGLSWVL